MAARTRPPFRADHVGSLLRPPQLLQAREDHKAGRIDHAELRGIEDVAIRDVVRRQEEVGLRSATDGEFRRASWHMDFIYRLGGVTRAAETMTVQLLEGRPEEMAVTTHMCRGNFRSSWVAEGGYDFVAEALFGELAVDGFFMEWDDDRSGGFEPLRFVPKGKTVVLGLVTTKRGALETKDELKRRIEEASRYVDVDQLCLSPQCGFSSTVDGNAITEEQQWDKLRLVVETAAEVWGG